ncbi:hypothetical protein NPIL_473881 [Nephila pilipes]|uniref:Uncharacterized protein n=1 Tax=Nephila pilipes TaxID=299642 RepID=A0A8X6UEN6_NEPPI|nr:hypothetical protein NPIL_473881 [Nephila pilipes]
MKWQKEAKRMFYPGYLILFWRTSLMEVAKVIIHPYRVPCGQHSRHYNAPTTNEMAAVLVVDALSNAKYRDMPSQ